MSEPSKEVFCRMAPNACDFPNCICDFKECSPWPVKEPSNLEKLPAACRELAHPSPPTEPVNLSALTNEALRQGKVKFFPLPVAKG